MNEIVLENGSLSVTILPDTGGRIEHFIDHATGRDWVWHPDGYARAERTLPVGASFDESWTGGWDEVFPNDAAGPFQGRNLVDHGELWSQPWQVMEESPLAVGLSRECVTVPAMVEKIVWLDRKKPHLFIDYAFENLSDEPLPFLFKLHAALAIEAADRIVMPSCLVEPVDLGFSTLAGKNGKSRFPKTTGPSGEAVLLDRIPPRESRQQEFLYATNLAHGACGLQNARTGTALGMAFDRKDVPYVWLFQSYGRWRDHYVLVMEPSTNVPYDLATARAAGTCAVLDPGSRKELSLTIGLSRRT